MSSEDSDSLEDASQTHYDQLVLVLNKIKVYVEMIAKRLSEVCGEDAPDHPRMLEGTRLRDYQQKGYKWIMTLYENGMNGILADEMGLGKTVQVISALAGLIEAGVPGPFLIVAPLSLLPVWADQLAAFAPRLPSLVYYGSLVERLKLRRRVRKRVRICLTDPLPTVADASRHESFRSGTTTTDSTAVSACLPPSSTLCEPQACSPVNTSSSLCSFPGPTHASNQSGPDCALGHDADADDNDLTEVTHTALADAVETDCLSRSNNSPDSFDVADRSVDQPDTFENVLSDSRADQLTGSTAAGDCASCESGSSIVPSSSSSGEALVASDSLNRDLRQEALAHLDDVITEVLANTGNLLEYQDTGQPDNTSTEALSGPVMRDTQTATTAIKTVGVGANTTSKLNADVFWAYPVVLTSYEVAVRDATYLRKIPFKGLIVDEGQRLKNPTNVLYKRLAKFNAGLRILLTGTPLQNRISELWSLLHFVLPEVFTSLEMFENWFDPVRLSDRAAQDRLVAAEVERALVTKLHLIISPFMLRRTKAESRVLLPPKREILLRVGMTQVQKDLYEQALRLCLNMQQRGTATSSANNSRRGSQGSLTWLDPANIIKDQCNPSAASKVRSPQRPLTRSHSQRTKSPPATRDPENGAMTETERRTRSQTRAIVKPPTEQSDRGPTTTTGKFCLSPSVSLNNGLMLLRQIANHPYLVIDRPDVDPAGTSQLTGESDSIERTATENDRNDENGLTLIDASEKTRLLDRLLNMLISSKHKLPSHWSNPTGPRDSSGHRGHC